MTGDAKLSEHTRLELQRLERARNARLVIGIAWGLLLIAAAVWLWRYA